jgi:hypothetical protein
MVSCEMNARLYEKRVGQSFLSPGFETLGALLALITYENKGSSHICLIYEWIKGISTKCNYANLNREPLLSLLSVI